MLTFEYLCISVFEFEFEFEFLNLNLNLCGNAAPHSLLDEEIHVVVGQKLELYFCVPQKRVPSLARCLCSSALGQGRSFLCTSCESMAVVFYCVPELLTKQGLVAIVAVIFVRILF